MERMNVRIRVGKEERVYISLMSLSGRGNEK